jgi:hypothetical protein
VNTLLRNTNMDACENDSKLDVQKAQYSVTIKTRPRSHQLEVRLRMVKQQEASVTKAEQADD